MMSTSTSVCEEILYIGDDAAPARSSLGRWQLTAWLAVGLIGGIATLAASVGIRNGIRDYQRQQCMDRLRRLGLAMQEFNQEHGHFPAPAIFDRDGRPLLSWRVALLPHLGYRSLYERFHLDEPWDGPHNRLLLSEMPREFACPAGSGCRTGRTTYTVIVGPENDAYSVNTAFEPTRGSDLRHFTDGTSNTILVLESDMSVPWTKPDDLHWVKGRGLPRLLSPHPEGAHSLFADGAVRFLKSTIRPEILLALLSMNGGEVIGSDG
jgi:prepilin-type processing-associated H-X9-DG protein